jgi:hypothetical protein
MPSKSLITGIVTNPDGTSSSGRLTVYLRAPKMTPAQLLALDKPILNVGFDATGEVSFNLQPNAELLPTGSYYEVHVFTRKTYWVEKWLVPQIPTVDFTTLKQGSSISSSFYTEEVSHEADIYNPHSVTIQQALSAQPNYIIPANRVDLTGTTITGAVAIIYPYEVLFEGEDTFILPVMIDLSSSNNIEVMLNGLEQTEGGTNDFLTIDSSTIRFNRGLHIGELVEIKVLKTV